MVIVRDILYSKLFVFAKHFEYAILLRPFRAYGLHIASWDTGLHPVLGYYAPSGLKIYLLLPSKKICA
jgi:hypothetical protein